MSQNVMTVKLQAALAEAFGEFRTDELKKRVAALCQGLRIETGNDDELDREWAERIYPRLDKWLNRLEEIESSYQRRVSLFLNALRADPVTAGLAELGNNLTQERLERSWGAITEYFESVMPDALLMCDNANLYIDPESATAWWIVDAVDDDVSVYLPAIAQECLLAAGEFSAESSRLLASSFVEALSNGSAPLPGFRISDVRDGIAMWQWRSPSAESSEDSVKHESSLKCDAEEIDVLSQSPEIAAELLCLGTEPLSESVPQDVSRWVSSLRSLGMSTRSITQQIGQSLGLCAVSAAEQGELVQFRIATEAQQALATATHEPGVDVTAE